MKDVRWIIDKNLLFKEDLEKFKEACETLNIEVAEANEEYPSDDKVNYFYADIPIIRKIYKESNSPGIFFDEASFSMENYSNKWGKHMLNPYAKFTTLEEFSKEGYDDEGFWFIKPDADDKKFSGMILPYKSIKDWQTGIKTNYEVILEGNTRIMVSQPSIIKKEWRTYVVDGKVLTSSVYKYFFEGLEAPETPEDLIKFVEERCKEYQPAKIFVMDIALCGNQYYIVECNCINTSAPYNCDVLKLVEGITTYIKNN